MSLKTSSFFIMFKVLCSSAVFFIFLVFYNFTRNIRSMTTIIINEKTKKGRIILDLIREMGAGKIIEDNVTSDAILNKTTIRAIQEAKEGKTIKCDDFEDYLNKIK